MFGRVRALELRIDAIERNFQSGIQAVMQRLDSIAMQPRDHPRDTPHDNASAPLATALAEGLKSIVEASTAMMQINAEGVSRMQDRAARVAVRDQASELGKLGAQRKREKRERETQAPIDAAAQQRADYLKQVGAACEDCAAAIEQRPTRHQDDMLRHVSEAHYSTYLAPNGVEIAPRVN